MAKDRATRTTISAVLIVKDEQAVLDRCLQSLDWVDEIVVYDTGSTDQTRDIARRHTPIVIEGYWDDDFAGARNCALEHATGDWVLSIDADEVFESQGATLRKHLARGTADSYGVRVLNLGRTSLDESYEFTANRVFRRGVYRWGGRLHEQLYAADGRHAAGPVLAGIRLLHTGYQDADVMRGVKAERNLTIVESELADAEQAGDLEAAATARVHLARSLILAGRWSRARDVAEQAWQPQLLPELVAEALAFGQVALCLNQGDIDGAATWVDRWELVQPDNVAVQIARARVCERQGEVGRALDALDRVPTVSRDAAGGEVTRASVADLEVRLLVEADRREPALRVAREALVAGSGALSPIQLFAVLGPEDLTSLLPSVPEGEWRRWALRCAQVGDTTAERVLTLMDAFRPQDAAVLACAARVAPRVGLQPAVEWSARLRKAGLDEQCTLVALAANDTAPARDRALAAALAYSAYRDERALPYLADALDVVPTQRQAELAAELEIVAPGLVTFE